MSEAFYFYFGPRGDLRGPLTSIAEVEQHRSELDRIRNEPGFKEREQAERDAETAMLMRRERRIHDERSYLDSLRTQTIALRGVRKVEP